MKKIVLAAVAALLSFTCQALTVVDWVQKEAYTSISRGDAVKIVRTANDVAARNRLCPLLVLAVMRQETGFRVGATSHEGARGIMQVIPRWHADKIKGRSLYSLSVGAEVGAQILAEYIDAARGDVRKALVKYSSNARAYPVKVLSFRARIMMETKDGGAMASPTLRPKFISA